MNERMNEGRKEQVHGEVSGRTGLASWLLLALKLWLHTVTKS